MNDRANIPVCPNEEREIERERKREKEREGEKTLLMRMSRKVRVKISLSPDLHRIFQICIQHELIIAALKRQTFKAFHFPFNETK